MKPDFRDLEKLAAGKEDENWRFRGFLKFYDDMTDEEIDLLVFKTADEVSSAIDCTRCGRCCTKLKPMCSEQDQQHLAAGLSITAEQLREQYLEYDESEDEPGWRMKILPARSFRRKNAPFMNTARTIAANIPTCMNRNLPAEPGA